MRESGDEKSTLRQIEKIKALSEDMLEYQAIDVHKAWQSMERRAKRKASMRMFSLFFTRAAAILVVPLLISSLFFSYLYYTTGRNVKTGASVVFAEISSMPGTITRLVLPDQSVVWLNAGSRLVYPSVFDEKERKVQLFGEGYFEVAYDDEPFIEAVLEKGKIDVIRNDERIRLEPNKQVVLNKESGVFRVSAVNLDEKMDWRKGRMVFRNTPLEKVLKRLEKRYNVEIVLHKNSNAEYKYRATFTNETLEQILDYLKQTAPIEWSARQLSSHSDSTFVRQRIDVYQR